MNSLCLSINSDTGIEIKVGVELEFYSRTPIAEMQKFINENFSLIHLVKKEMVEGQFEIITIPDKNLEGIASEINQFKAITQKENNFTAKPFLNLPGSAMHIHISLHDATTGKNITGREAQARQHIVGGLCECIKRSMIYFAPNPLCYKRFQYYDKFTPRFATWGFSNNKSNAIRVTKNTIEHRVPCADTDVTDVLSVILAAMECGFKNKIIPRLPHFGDPRYSTDMDLRIPLTHKESINYAEQFD